MFGDDPTPEEIDRTLRREALDQAVRFACAISATGSSVSGTQITNQAKTFHGFLTAKDAA